MAFEHARRDPYLRRLSKTVAEILASKLGDSSVPLHGLYEPSVSDFSSRSEAVDDLGTQLYGRTMFFPFSALLGHVVREFGTNRERLDPWFDRGLNATFEIFPLLIRSINKLEIEQARYLRATEITDLSLNELMDISIYLDSITTYLRTFTDLVAMTFPSVILEKPVPAKRPSLRDILSYVKKKENANPQMVELINRAPLDWFYKLAGRTGHGTEDSGIRQYRFHYGAYIMFPGAFECDQSGNPIRSRLEPQLIRRANTESNNIITDLQKITHGFLSFLDCVTREAFVRDKSLLSSPWLFETLWPHILNDSFEFLKTFVPTIVGPPIPPQTLEEAGLGHVL